MKLIMNGFGDYTVDGLVRLLDPRPCEKHPTCFCFAGACDDCRPITITINTGRKLKRKAKPRPTPTGA